jgi:hypothetical protein
MNVQETIGVRDLTIDEIEEVSGGKTLVEIVKAALGWMVGKMADNVPGLR